MFSINNSQKSYTPLLLIIFFLFIILYFFFPNQGSSVQSWDNIPTALLPITILNEHNLDFNEFEEGKSMLLNKSQVNSKYPQYYFFVNKNNKVVANYPVLSGLIITPFYLFYSLIKPNILHAQTFYNSDVYHINFITSILITLINSFFIYTIIKNKTKSPLISLLGLLLFIFATPVIHTTSRFIWQHTIALLFFTLVIYSFQKSNFFLALFFSTIAFLTRPPVLLLCLPFLLNLTVKLIKSFKTSKLSKSNWFFLVCSLLLILFQIWYSQSYLDSKYFFAPQYSNNPPINIGPQYTLLQRFNGNVFIGFLGLLISPGRGLLFFSPLFIFSFIELIKSIKQNNNSIYGISFLLYFLLFIKNDWWYGGWTISYRYLIETIPILILSFCSYLYKISWKKLNPQVALIIITIIISLIFNTQIGANYGDCGFNSYPSDIDHLNKKDKIKRLFFDSPIYRCLLNFHK